jgi:hypothetical protein
MKYIKTPVLPDGNFIKEPYKGEFRYIGKVYSRTEGRTREQSEAVADEIALALNAHDAQAKVREDQQHLIDLLIKAWDGYEPDEIDAALRQVDAANNALARVMEGS